MSGAAEGAILRLFVDAKAVIDSLDERGTSDVAKICYRAHGARRVNHAGKRSSEIVAARRYGDRSRLDGDRASGDRKAGCGRLGECHGAGCDDPACIESAYVRRHHSWPRGRGEGLRGDV